MIYSFLFLFLPSSFFLFLPLPSSFLFIPFQVKFFSQGTLPCLTLEGKMMLETGSKVGEAADGNGGIYAALQQTGQIEDMEASGVKYVKGF